MQGPPAAHPHQHMAAVLAAALDPCSRPEAADGLPERKAQCPEGGHESRDRVPPPRRLCSTQWDRCPPHALQGAGRQPAGQGPRAGPGQGRPVGEGHGASWEAIQTLGAGRVILRPGCDKAQHISDSDMEREVPMILACLACASATLRSKEGSSQTWLKNSVSIPSAHRVAVAVV